MNLTPSPLLENFFKILLNHQEKLFIIDSFYIIDDADLDAWDRAVEKDNAKTAESKSKPADRPSSSPSPTLVSTLSSGLVGQ